MGYTVTSTFMINAIILKITAFMDMLSTEDSAFMVILYTEDSTFMVILYTEDSTVVYAIYRRQHIHGLCYLPKTTHFVM